MRKHEPSVSYSSRRDRLSNLKIPPLQIHRPPWTSSVLDRWSQPLPCNLSPSWPSNLTWELTSRLGAQIQPGSSDPSFLGAFLCPLLDCYRGFSPFLMKIQTLLDILACQPAPPAMETTENHRISWKCIKYIQIYKNLWTSIETHRNLLKSMKIYGN